MVGKTASRSATPTSLKAIHPSRRQRRSGAICSSVEAAQSARSSRPRRIAFWSRLIATQGEIGRGSRVGWGAALGNRINELIADEISGPFTSASCLRFKGEVENVCPLTSVAPVQTRGRGECTFRMVSRHAPTLGYQAASACLLLGMKALDRLCCWIEQGLSPKTVQAFAGHASLQLTQDRYGHLFPSEDHKVAMDKIARALLG